MKVEEKKVVTVVWRGRVENWFATAIDAGFERYTLSKTGPVEIGIQGRQGGNQEFGPGFPTILTAGRSKAEGKNGRGMGIGKETA